LVLADRLPERGTVIEARAQLARAAEVERVEQFAPAPVREADRRFAVELEDVEHEQRGDELPVEDARGSECS
jgi:hypothetical protein